MRHSRTLPLAAAACLALAAPALATEDDNYMMGAGRWTCGDILDHMDAGNASEIGQIAGWVLGYWSAATLVRDTRFVDIVEQVGGRAIFDKTVAECRNAPADTMLYLVTKSMIANTK